MPPATQPHINRLLAALPRKSYRRILPKLEPVALDFGQVLFQADASMRHVYFPGDCVVSLLAVADGRPQVEVGVVGSEGMVGISLALGFPKSPVQGLVQGAGTATRNEAVDLRRAMAADRVLERMFTRYAHVSLSTAMRIAACNNTHLLEARMARWLLMMRDRLSSDAFYLTHAVLAEMLGVQRAGVTRAAGTLQRRDLIAYRRGTLTILDGKALRSVACNCYGVLRKLDVDAAASVTS
jgi:CRP-like cAMP-binding protein